LTVGQMIGYSVLGSVGAYVITSLVFLKFPLLLHKKKKRHFYCSHISHRGGAAEQWENTMDAFRNAAAKKTDMFELDVHITKDKKVVVAHDKNLERVTECEGVICEYLYDELPPLKNKLDVTFSKNMLFESSDKNERKKFALLEDVFKEFPDMPVNLDVKDHDLDLIDCVNDLIVKYKKEKTVVWGSSNKKTADILYEKNKDIALFFSGKNAMVLYFYFIIGLLPFISIREQFLDIPAPGCWKNTKVEVNGLKRIVLAFLDFLLGTKSLVKHLHERGIPTYYWVLNDEADFKRAFEIGCEGVMTDCPEKLRKFLDENPRYDVRITQDTLFKNKAVAVEN